LLFNTEAGETDGTIDIPGQNFFNLPVQVPLLSMDSLVFSYETGSGPATFTASLNSREPQLISGIFRQSGIELPFTIKKSKTETYSSVGIHSEDDLKIDLDEHTIAGSLVTPAEYEDSQLVIFVNGSGTESRNNRIAGFDIFKELAEQLADRGIFSYRFDVRGTGTSGGNRGATIPELAEDLKGVWNFFNKGEGVNGRTFSSITFLGYSYGGVVSLIAADEAVPDRLVLMASPVLPGDKVITQQIQKIAEMQEVPEEIVEQNLEFQKRVNEAARSGEGWEELEKDIENRLREQLDELPEQQRRTLGDMDRFISGQVARQLEGSKTRWFKSFIETDPRPYLRGQEIPVLALFAEQDMQVLTPENREAIEEIGGDIHIRTFPNSNHLFQESETGMPGEYGMLEKRFIPGLSEEIVRFILGEVH